MYEIVSAKDISLPLADEDPGLPPTNVRIVDQDTVTAGLALPRAEGDPPALVVNFANADTPGGGWLHGAPAQEEAIFFRSSIHLSLPASIYPIPERSGVYSPYVAIVRNDFRSNYTPLVLPEAPQPLATVSVMSVPAISRPKTKTVKKSIPGVPASYTGFATTYDRVYTKDLMRLVLFVAASRGHTRLVLGALGCGVFRNPPHDVALCWREVLQENLGCDKDVHWWDDVVFAIVKSEENTAIFTSVLDGLEV